MSKEVFICKATTVWEPSGVSSPKEQVFSSDGRSASRQPLAHSDGTNTSLEQIAAMIYSKWLNKRRGRVLVFGTPPAVSSVTVFTGGSGSRSVPMETYVLSPLSDEQIEELKTHLKAPNQ